MQSVSNAYKVAMKKPFRNKGYIRAWIGIVNMNAQSALFYDDPRNDYAPFASLDGVINSDAVNRVYATCEENFSAVDGTMYFMPLDMRNLYNQGIVTRGLFGTVYITFGGRIGFDIKGLTIDFGVCYPTRIRIESDNGVHEYENNSQIFVTEDVFDGTSFFVITALEMLGGRDRLRINKFTCGIAHTFGNKETEEYFFKDYSSTLSDTIPSHDMTLTVNNRDLYFSPDNPESALAYLEQGQEIEVSFGYDIDDNGTVEWVDPTRTYLKTWSADDSVAKFNAVDIFAFKMSETFYDGRYRASGVSLYELAEEVFLSGGIDSEGYYIDPYLRKVIVNNPLPVTSHANCIQIIANAGRCALLLERGNRICIKSQFIPDSTISTNNQTYYSNIANLLSDSKKTAYAETSWDYSMVNDTMLFFPKGMRWYESTGYVSESIYSNGVWNGDTPSITITFESSWSFYGYIVIFRSIAPSEFTVTYYKDGSVVGIETIESPEIEYTSFETSPETDKMVFTFTKGSHNARVFVDNILINDVTDYTIQRHNDMRENAPTAIRQNRIQSISVKRYIYRNATDGKTLTQGEIELPVGITVERAFFPRPSYGATVEITDGTANATIIKSSSHYADIQFTLSSAQTIKYAVNGYEYIVDNPVFINKYREFGDAVEWDNPLISRIDHAKDMEEWLSSYYLGDVDYTFDWRGDPRVDANDLFYLELREREDTLIRAYQSELNFNGAWKGNIRARKAVVSWR